MMVNNLLRKYINKAGYYKTTSTPGLWRHKWRPVMFVLIVSDFGIEYLGNIHLHHLRTVLTNHYTITEDLDGIYFLASKSSGTMTRTTPNKHVAYPRMATIPTCSSSLGAKPLPSLNFFCTITVTLSTAPSRSWRQRRTPSPSSPIQA